MNINEMNGNKHIPVETIEAIGEQPESLQRPVLPAPSENETIEGHPREEEPGSFATRADLASKPGMDKSNPLLHMLLLASWQGYAFTSHLRQHYGSSGEPRKQNAIGC
jgi:hypothetical protein